MDKRSHIIRQQVFEIDFSSKEKSRHLQDRISFLFNNQLTKEMEDLFERMIPSNKLIKVENLTIDIGDIALDSLDTELTSRVIEKLEEQLLLLLLHDNSPVSETDSADPGVQGSFLSLLEYFLLRGSLPWWAASKNSDTPFQAIDFLLIHSAGELRALILETGQKSYVRRRLVYQFTQHQLRSVISILEPAEAEFIFEYHTDVIEVQREKQLVKSSEAEFKSAVWEFILTYLIVDRGTHFNRKEFVKSTLRSMSAHFNIDFRELLYLFASALIPGSLYRGNTDSLQAIILELNTEEVAQDRQTVLTGQSMEKTPEDTGTEIELLRYYLTFGSFPWWSDGRSMQDLELFMSDLITEYPKTFESLIKNVGQQQYSRRLIATTFKEDLLHGILKVIEPGNAGFIIDYVAEVKVTHTKKATFKTQSEDLSFAVWEFILEFLLVDRGSEFNRLIFLESNIRKLASRFNAGYTEVLVFMVQNIAVSHSNSARHLSLFHGLTTLYKQSNEKGELDGASTVFDSQEDLTSRAQAIQATNLKNVLYFWIKSGYLPWWAGEYAHYSPSELFGKLIAGAPADAIVFLKFAGLKDSARRRLVYQISFHTLSELFRLLPGGRLAFQYSDRLLALREVDSIGDDTKSSVYEHIILFSLWNALITTSYTRLDYRLFIRSAISGFALQLRIPAPHLFRSSELIDEPGLDRLFDKEVANENGRSEHFDPDLLAWAGGDEIRLLAALTARKRPTGKEADKKDIREEGLYVLRYFLQQGKLPEQVKEYSSASVAPFLKQLLLLLFREIPSELSAVLNSDQYSGENLLFLHELFTSADSIDGSNLNKLFVSTIEKNILSYIRRKGDLEPGNSIIEFIDKYIRSPESRRDAELIGQLLAYSSVALHLAYHYKNKDVYRLIESHSVLRAWGRWIRTFNLWLFNAFQDRVDRERLELLSRTFNFMINGSAVSIGSPGEYASSFFKFLYERDYQLMLKLSASAGKILSADPPGNLTPDSLIEIRQELQAYSRFNEVAEEVEKAMSAADDAAQSEIYEDGDQLEDLLALVLKKEQEEQKMQETADDKDHLPDRDTIYIKNAGLVILHPFLSTYFNRLGMLDKGDFLSGDMRQRAVHLLQYLAFGTENSEEHELVLNKILCNIPLEEPAIPGIELTEHEKTVSAELLNAVLVQWEKLKNTSAESLQTSFLRREGALNRIEENWNLKVEERGYDVLLQTLPWGLGMIKTSWMTEFIYVEWM